MQGGYNSTAHNAVYLCGGGGGLQHRPRVRCRRGWLGWGGGLQHVPSCLSGLVRVGGYNTDPVLRAILSVGVGGYNTDCVLPAILSVGGGGVTTQTVCYVLSCLSVGVGGGYNTDRVLRAVLSVGVGGVTTQTVCYVLSCLSVGVGGGLQHRPCVTCRPVCRGGGYNTDRVLRAVLSVCRGGVGVTTQTVCYVLSCLSGWGGLQHRPCFTCCPVCLSG